MDEFDLALADISFLSLQEKIFLKKNLDNLSDLAVLSIADISLLIKRPIRTALWDGARVSLRAIRNLRLLEKCGIGGVRCDEPAFPALLREMFDPPYLLLYRGSLAALQKPCVSVVGTRAVCEEAAEATMEFARSAAQNGFCVVSGLAYGVDSFAHRGALSSGEQASTVAVLPCGIDTVMPSANKSLARHIIASGGALVSEYVPGSPPEPWRYVQRNRIVAAVSSATVVTQAPPGSGALITADFAIDYNRELLFHEVCFCDSAKQAYERGARRLMAKKNGASKMRNTPEKFLEEGAPVIKNYADFVAVRQDVPGGHSLVQGGQLSLFAAARE